MSISYNNKDYKSLNNIVKIFEDLAEWHDQINDYGYGKLEDLNDNRDIKYPILFLELNSIDMPKVENGYSVLDFDLQLSIIDKRKTLDNTKISEESDLGKEISSDSHQMLIDIIQTIHRHNFYKQQNLSIDSDITFEFDHEKFEDDTNLVTCSIILRSILNRGLCSAPFSNLSLEDIKNYVLITDIENPNSPIKKYEGDTYTCQVADPKSGIVYQRPIKTEQISSWALYDDGWHRTNGTYDYVPPSNPASTASLIPKSFITLKENNAFGNKNRFTDDEGTQVYTRSYIIDHLTGLGWYRYTLTANYTWAVALEWAHNWTGYGYTDWRVPNLNELSSIYQRQVGLYMTNYTPMSTMNQSKNTHTSTKVTANAPYFYFNNCVWGYISAGTVASSPAYFYVCRNHYN